MAADVFTVDLKNDHYVSASMRHECARERKTIGRISGGAGRSPGGKAMCTRRNASVGLKTLPIAYKAWWSVTTTFHTGCVVSDQVLCTHRSAPQ
jgi:hypothetical protein